MVEAEVCTGGLGARSQSPGAVHGLLCRRPHLQFSLKGSHLLRRQPLLLQQSLIATHTQTESQAVSQLGSIQQSWYTKQQCKVHYHFDSNCLYCFVQDNWYPSKGKYCASHMLQHLAGMDKHMDNLCKQRAYCLHHSFIIIHPERIPSACFVEEQCNGADLQKFPIPKKPGGTEHAQTVCTEHEQTVCTRLFFSAHTQEQ